MPQVPIRIDIQNQDQLDQLQSKVTNLTSSLDRIKRQGMDAGGPFGGMTASAGAANQSMDQLADTMETTNKRLEAFQEKAKNSMGPVSRTAYAAGATGYLLYNAHDFAFNFVPKAYNIAHRAGEWGFGWAPRETAYPDPSAVGNTGVGAWGRLMGREAAAPPVMPGMPGAAAEAMGAGQIAAKVAEYGTLAAGLAPFAAVYKFADAQARRTQAETIAAAQNGMSFDTLHRAQQYAMNLRMVNPQAVMATLASMPTGEDPAFRGMLASRFRIAVGRDASEEDVLSRLSQAYRRQPNYEKRVEIAQTVSQKSGQPIEETMELLRHDLTSLHGKLEKMDASLTQETLNGMTDFTAGIQQMGDYLPHKLIPRVLGNLLYNTGERMRIGALNMIFGATPRAAGEEVEDARDEALSRRRKAAGLPSSLGEQWAVNVAVKEEDFAEAKRLEYLRLQTTWAWGPDGDPKTIAKPFERGLMPGVLDREKAAILSNAKRIAAGSPTGRPKTLTPEERAAINIDRKASGMPPLEPEVSEEDWFAPNLRLMGGAQAAIPSGMRDAVPYTTPMPPLGDMAAAVLGYAFGGSTGAAGGRLLNVDNWSRYDKNWTRPDAVVPGQQVTTDSPYNAMGGTLAQGQAHAQAISRKLHGDEFDLSDTQGLQEVILGMKALQATHTARRSKLGQSGMTAAERITGKGGFSSVGDEDEQWVTDTINGPTMRYGLNQEFKLEGTIESWSKAYEWSKKYRDNLGGLSQIMVQHAAELDKIEKRWDEMQAKHLTPTAAEMADQVRYPQLLEKVQLESVEASIKRRRNRTRDFLPRGLRDEMLAEDYSDQGGQIVTAYDNRTDPITGSEVAPERIRERRVSRLGPRAAAAYQRDQQIGKIALSKSAKGSSVKIDGRTVLMAASMWDAKSVGDAVANVQEEYGLNVEPTNIMLARMKIQADSEAAIGLLHATALPGDNLGIARRQIEIMKKAADDSFSAGTRSTEESVQNEINKRSLDDKLKSMALQEETLRKRLPVQWRAQAGLTAAEQAAQLKQIGSRLESPDLEPARIRTRHDASIAALAGFREAMSPTMTGIPLEQFRNTVTVQEKAVDSEKAKEEEEFRVQRELQRRQFHAAGITEEAQYGVGRMRRWIWPDQARSPEYNEQMLRRESTAFEQALPDRHLPAQQTTFEREQLQRRQADSRNELAFGNWRQWQSSTIQNQQGENQLRAITERSHILPGDDAKLAALTYEDRIRDAEKLNALTNDRITMEQDERQAYLEYRITVKNIENQDFHAAQGFTSDLYSTITNNRNRWGRTGQAVENMLQAQGLRIGGTMVQNLTGMAYDKFLGTVTGALRHLPGQYTVDSEGQNHLTKWGEIVARTPMGVRQTGKGWDHVVKPPPPLKDVPRMADTQITAAEKANTVSTDDNSVATRELTAEMRALRASLASCKGGMAGKVGGVGASVVGGPAGYWAANAPMGLSFPSSGAAVSGAPPTYQDNGVESNSVIRYDEGTVDPMSTYPSGGAPQSIPSAPDSWGGDTGSPSFGTSQSTMPSAPDSWGGDTGSAYPYGAMGLRGGTGATDVSAGPAGLDPSDDLYSTLYGSKGDGTMPQADWSEGQLGSWGSTPKGPSTLGRDVGMVGAAVGAGFGIYRGVKQGGVRGFLNAGTSGLMGAAGIAALIPGGQAAAAVMGAIAIGMQLTSALMPNKRIQREKEIARWFGSTLYRPQTTVPGMPAGTAAFPINASFGTGGGETDYDFHGQLRNFAYGANGQAAPSASTPQPPQILIQQNMSAMDASSIYDRRGDLAEGVRQALLDSHPLGSTISKLYS